MIRSAGMISASILIVAMPAVPVHVCFAQSPPLNETVTDPGDNGGPNQLRAKLAAIQSSAGGGNLTFNIGSAIIVLSQGVLPAITKDTTIDGGGIVTISGGNSSGILRVNSGASVTLRSLTLTKAVNVSSDGGAVRNSGSLTIDNCKFLENQASPPYSGGAIWSIGPLTIKNSEFAFNTADNGGALYPRFTNAVTTITGCNFHDNGALSFVGVGGGAILLWDGASADINQSLFSKNGSNRDGGAIYVTPNSSIKLTDSSLLENVALRNGGAIDVTGGAVFAVDCEIGGNQAQDAAALWTNNANVVLVATNFTGNDSRNSAAITTYGLLMTMTNCTVADNTVYNTADTGAGIANIGGILHVNGCTIRGNGNTGGQAYGGGLFNGGLTTLTNSTFSGNRAAFGGGIYNSDGNASLLNVTLSGNVAYTGGGIFTRFKYAQAGPVTLKNTILAANAGGNLFEAEGAAGSITSQGYNLSDDVSTGIDGKLFLAASGDRNDQDAKLGPLADNGGITLTHLPQAASPAIDNATGSGAPATDQRGVTRPQGLAVDIGAVEVAPPTPTATPTATATATPTATPTTTPGTTLANISTRLPVQTGDNVLIGGFIVTGAQPKTVIIRGLGPSLPVPGAMANPTLELFSGNVLLQSNDNWIESANKQAIIDSTIPPANDLESAIVAQLPANNSAYTAVVRGANGGTGIAVVEAYDLDRSVDSKLTNISTRGFVQTGDNVLIAGTIIAGQTSQKVLVRAIGPSLSIPGKMENPILELRDANGELVEVNDDWVTSPNKQAIIDSTIPPTNDLESAIVRTLSPAAYTAIVRGANNSAGIAVVEVYALN